MATIKLNDNGDTFYRIIKGNPRMPYLVFLHEGLGCTDMMQDFPAKLCNATGCPGLCYDRLGYGKSSPATKLRTVHYLHDSALNELPLVLGSVIPEKKFILIGHSDGGSISLIFAAERPKLLQAVITEAAHVFVDSETISGIKSALAAWHGGKMKGLVKYHGDKTETVFKSWANTWLSTWFRHWNIEYLLPSLTAPLLVIQGVDDQYGSSAQYKLIKTKSKGSVDLKIIKNCGHIPHLEAQPLVLHLMTEFISRIAQVPRI